MPLLGFGLPVSGAWASPETMRRTARRAEELGYASLWSCQLLLFPVGAELPPSHRAVLDPVVSLANVAAHTDRIRLGTATVCAPLTESAATRLPDGSVINRGRHEWAASVGRPRAS